MILKGQTQSDIYNSSWKLVTGFCLLEVLSLPIVVSLFILHLFMLKGKRKKKNLSTTKKTNHIANYLGRSNVFQTRL